ncbi:uncharacterized protein LOC130360954 [Hyla sarda]|uniref:uncharacterized protein LOC130360954 n=1 Tax=Hyla sarda TaxID=327740 RepID=UPI0024C36EC7|nr:uncharacterized protein LOC130360954 [Hyla sarda]
MLPLDPVTVLLFIITCIFLATVLFKEKEQVHENYPPGPKPWPIIGNIFNLNIKKPYLSFQELAKKYGPVFSIKIGGQKMVVLSGYDTVKEALVNHAEELSGRPIVPIFMDFFRGYGVIFSNGHNWKNMRRFTLSALRDLGMGKRSVEDKITEESNCLVETFKSYKGEPFDSTMVMNAAVSNIIISLLLGHRFEYDDPKLHRLLVIIMDTARILGSPMALLYNAFPSLMRWIPGSHQTVRKTTDELHLFIREVFTKQRDELDVNDQRNLIDCFLVKQKEEKPSPELYFHDKNLTSLVVDLFAAGMETTSTTLRWGLLLMMKYPEVQKNVQKEIEKFIGTAEPQLVHRQQMPYTDAVIHETQRFANLVPTNLPHMTTQGVTLKGFFIPKGTHIIPSLTSVLQDTKYFNKPDEFYPQHFLDSDGNFVKNEAFMPFSAGKRSCAGENLAKIELFLFFTKLLQNFTFKAPPGVKLDLTAAVGFTSTPLKHEICAIPRKLAPGAPNYALFDIALLRLSSLGSPVPETYSMDGYIMDYDLFLCGTMRYSHVRRAIRAERKNKIYVPELGLYDSKKELHTTDMASIDPFTFVLSIVLLLLINFFYQRIKQKGRKFPPGPYPLPLVGNIFSMNMARPYKSFQKFAEQYGSVFSLRIGTEEMVILSGYDTVKDALINHAEEFAGRPCWPVYEELRKGHGIILANGENWKVMRRFTVSTLRDFGMGKKTIEDKINEECGYLIKNICSYQGEAFQDDKIINAAVANIIVSIILGHRFDYQHPSLQRLLQLTDENFKVAGSSMVFLYNAFPSLVRWLPGCHRSIHKNANVLNKFVTETFTSYKKQLDVNDQRNLIETFLVKQQEEKPSPDLYFNNENLTLLVTDLFSAGMETTTTTLRWGLLLMMKYPEIQKNVQNEIEKVIGSAVPLVKHRKEMPYTDAVIHEIQRFANILPANIPHATTQDVVFRGYFLPKGTHVIPLLTSVLQDKKYFERPEEFYPQHFLDTKGNFVKNEAFIPFSLGKRSCAGESLAKTELFLFFTTLLQKFTFKAPPGEKLQLIPAVGLTTPPVNYRICALPRN